MPRYREENINIRFGDILKEMGFKASAEIISGRKLPDVMVNVDGVKINIEGRFVKSSQVGELEKKCKRRVEDGICDIAAGILYPEEIRKAKNDKELIQKIKESDLQCFVISLTSKGVEKTDLGRIKIKDFAEKLNYFYTGIISTDLLQEQIKNVSSVIEKTSEMAAISGLFFRGEEVIKKIESVLGIKISKEYTEEAISKDLIKIGFFVIFDGLMFHEVFSGTLEARKAGVQSLRSAPRSNLTSFLEKEWEKIRKVNYLPIFNLASSVCSCLPTSPESDGVLKKLIEATLNVVSSGVLLKHDLMGRIYHKLLLKTTGKYYAAYYTSIPAAWILCNLSAKTSNPELKWNFESLESIKDFRIIDPSCGSGTLLSGIYMALKDKYIFDLYKAGGPVDLDLDNFHKIMLEYVLNGWDILDYAGHLTLTTLALHNPDSAFVSSNIYVLPIGDTGKQTLYLGSLDYLDTTREQRLLFKEYMTLPKKKGLDIEKEKMLSVPKQSMDIVTMNPPFSRSAQPNIKFGFVEEKTMIDMNKKLRKLGSDLEYKGIGKAGLGAYFIILADQLLRPGGRLALVIPRSILSGPSWEEIRKRVFLSGYEIEYIVSNYDPGDKKLSIQPWNWSENTNLGEVLIVARKTNKSAKNRYTTFINLWNKPRNELESLKIVSDSIRLRAQGERKEFLEGNGDYEELELNNKGVGVAYNVSQKYLEKSFLIPCLFAFPDLNRLVFEITHKDLLPLVPLGERTNKLGVDTRQIHEVFKLVSHQTKYPIVWGCPGNLETMALKNFQYVAPLKKDAERIYSNNAGNLLIAERIWTNSAKLLSMISPDPILATEFWEVSLGDQNEEKILSMWMNSTFGFLIFLASSISNRQDRFTLKKEYLSALPVLDISALSKKTRQGLLDLYERLKDSSLSVFPQEFKLAFSGTGTRKKIDEIFLKTLGLEIDLKPYYRMLSRDPIINLERL
jgi:hypothetical protein